MRTPQEVVRAWAEAYNTRDVDALLALYLDDSVNQSVAGNEWMVGRPAIRRAAQALFQAFPDIIINAEIVLQVGAWVAIEWSGKASWLGQFAGGLPDGRQFTPWGAAYFHVVDGQIRMQRGYFDRAAWFGQLGIPWGVASPSHASRRVCRTP